MRYRKRPVRLPEAKIPAEADRRTRRAGLVLAGFVLAIAFGVALLVGMHRVLHYEYLRTGYVFVAAMTIPFIPLALVFTYVAHRRPRAVFTTQVEIPGTNAARFVTFFMVCAYYAIAAGTMVYGFITGYPVHAFLWAAGPASAGYLLANGRHMSLHTLLMPKQSFTLSPHALTITASPLQGEVRIPWTDNARVGTTNLAGTEIHPDPSIPKLTYTIKFDCPATSLTQLDRLLHHFNTHPHDRPLLAQPEGAQLVQTLLDTTPQP